jgi:hypothetical protein
LDDQNSFRELASLSRADPSGISPPVGIFIKSFLFLNSVTHGLKLSAQQHNVKQFPL